MAKKSLLRGLTDIFAPEPEAIPVEEENQTIYTSEQANAGFQYLADALSSFQGIMPINEDNIKTIQFSQNVSEGDIKEIITNMMDKEESKESEDALDRAMIIIHDGVANYNQNNTSNDVQSVLE